MANNNNDKMQPRQSPILRHRRQRLLCTGLLIFVLLSSYLAYTRVFIPMSASSTSRLSTPKAPTADHEGELPLLEHGHDAAIAAAIAEADIAGDVAAKKLKAEEIAGMPNDETAADATAVDGSAATPTAAPVRDQVPMKYGTNARPPLKGLKQLEQLDRRYVPTTAANSPRLIIIGDVHGQLASLEALLKKADYSKSRGDHVVFAGDMISKGPDSAGVVQLAMDMGASAVRGNHEDRVLLAYDRLSTYHVVGTGSSADGKMAKVLGTEKKAGGNQAVLLTAADIDDMAEPMFSTSEYQDLSVARGLTPEQRAWLAARPVILRVGDMPSIGEVVVVHAGLVPNLPLERQDPLAVMNMRTFVFPAYQTRFASLKGQMRKDALKRGRRKMTFTDEEVDAEMERTRREEGAGREDYATLLPIDRRDGRSWSDVWNEKMKELDPKDRTTVVYGHDAKTGLNVQEYSFGIDTGCTKGGKLTALVFEPDGKEAVRHKLVSVKCQEATKGDESQE